MQVTVSKQWTGRLSWNPGLKWLPPTGLPLTSGDSRGTGVLPSCKTSLFTDRREITQSGHTFYVLPRPQVSIWSMCNSNYATSCKLHEGWQTVVSHLHLMLGMKLSEIVHGFGTWISWAGRSEWRREGGGRSISSNINDYAIISL